MAADGELPKKRLQSRSRRVAPSLRQRLRNPETQSSEKPKDQKPRHHPAGKQRTHTDQPAPVDGSGGGPFLIHSELSKIDCRRQVLIPGQYRRTGRRNPPDTYPRSIKKRHPNSNPPRRAVVVNPRMFFAYNYKHGFDTHNTPTNLHIMLSPVNRNI